MRRALIILLVLCVLYVEARHHGRYVRRVDRNERYLENYNTSVINGTHPRGSSTQRRVSVHRNRHPTFTSTNITTLSNETQTYILGNNGKLHSSAKSHRKSQYRNSTTSNGDYNRKDRHRSDKSDNKLERGGHVKGTVPRQRLSRNYRRRVHHSVNSTSSNAAETLCANMSCSHKEECIADASSNEPICVPKFSRHAKPLHRQNGNKNFQIQKVNVKEHWKGKPILEGNATKIETPEEKQKAQQDAKKRAQEMKDQAKSFERHYEKIQDDRKSRLIHGNGSSSENNSQANAKPRVKGLDNDKLPPCLEALKAVPHLLIAGAPMLPAGAYVPACDSDGYYSAEQCSSVSGECWCADRMGNERSGTRVIGSPNCK